MPQMQKPPDLDEQGKPVLSKPPDLDENHQPIKEESFLGKAWKAISEPLITAPSELAHGISESMTDPNTHPGWLKSFAAGGIEGIGDLISGLSSPVNLAMAGLTGGESIAAKAGLPQAARLLNIGSRVASAPMAIHGAETMFDPESTLGQRAMGFGELAGGGAGMLHTPSIKPREALPEIKPTINPALAEAPLHPTGSIDDLIAGLQNKPGDIESMTPTGIGANASGESAASLEALSRQEGMKSRGEQFVVYDKAGNKRPIIGPDAVDYQVRPGETFGVEGPQGFSVFDDSGGKYPKPEVPAKSQATITQQDPISITIKKPDPEVIKQVMQKGYVFDSIRDDGSFKMVKSKKPLDLPILEAETNRPGARPTPANAARMGQPPIPPKGPGPITGEGGGPLGKGKPLVPEHRPLVEAYNFPRAVMASIDMSAPLRQGLPLIHKKQFWTSLDDMFNAWGSENAYKQIQSDILERPLFKSRELPNGTIVKSFAEEAGLKLTDLNSLSGREEALMSSWAEKVPGVRRSNRAYTAFLNKLRADTFESLIKTSKIFGADGTTNLPLARELAEFVNTASGRGSLGNLEKSAVTLNSLLFSPRLIASRLKMLNPATYIMANPTVRKEYLKSLFAIAVTGNIVTQLGRMAGGTVESDPASSDFGKLKIGNARLDPYGGFQQYIVAASRLLSGRNVSSTSEKEYDLNNPKGPYDPTNMDVIGRFAQGKLHPVLGFAYALLKGQKEMSGQPMNLTTPNPMENAIAQRFIPILMQDVYQLAQEDPSLIPILGTLSGLGMSTQVYGGGSQ